MPQLEFNGKTLFALFLQRKYLPEDTLRGRFDRCSFSSKSKLQRNGSVDEWSMYGDEEQDDAMVDGLESETLLLLLFNFQRANNF